MNKKIKRFIKIYPWYAGLTGDLLFYIAIDTLFLTVVKNFSVAQIVSLSTFSSLSFLVLQFLLLWVIKKIGNTDSVRFGALCLLISAILITFSKSYLSVVAGRIFHDISIIFRNISFVTLENNLELIGKRREYYVDLRTKGNSIYAIITMLISFVAGFMFNCNNYLPMYCCIISCTIGYFLSFFMSDFSDYDKILKKEKGKNLKIKFNNILVVAIVLYGLYFPLVQLGQSEGKLFIQQNLLESFPTDKTSIIISGILCISRIVRVLSNFVFRYAYRKFNSYVGLALSILLSASLGLLLFGSFIPQIYTKIMIMSLGYVIILFIRDPFKIYMQDIVLENTAKEYHQTALTIIEFSVKTVNFSASLIFSLILLKYHMVTVIAIMFVLAAVEIVFSIKLYKLINGFAERKMLTNT